MRYTALSALFMLTALMCACGDDDSSTSGCDIESPQTGCGEGLVCAEQPDGSGRCQIPAGGPCDPDAADPNCRTGSACISVEGEDAVDGEEPDALCLVLEAGICDPLAPFCVDGLTCAEVEDETRRCFAPVFVRGTVIDAIDDAAIAGAHVVALDEESVAVTDIAVTVEPAGAYELELPATRDTEGRPVDAQYTLRSAAAGYQTFPSGLRTALPLNTASAVETDGAWIVEDALTTIALISLADDGVVRHTVSGRVQTADVDESPPVLAALAGVLVVADGETTTSAITDRSGYFTLFNVPDGSYALAGYASGVAVEPETVAVSGTDVNDVVLTASIGTLATVSGNVQIVNAPGGSSTSVVLMVRDTFDDVFIRGEVPRGLRAPRSGTLDVTGSFSIADVPDGEYVVLAAFENDNLVRDPDTNISGTDIVFISVEGADITVSDSFKITEALEVFGPGADEPEAVSAPPLLRWADDSSEDYYEVRVFDAFGNEVWNDESVPSVSGGDEVSVQYGGPLDAGMYYQFRVTSWRQPGNGQAAPISASEDLRGVFFTAP